MERKFISRRRIRIPITWFVDYEGDGVFGTGIVQNFSVDGWHITTIEPRPIHVGMSLALRVTLPNQPIPIHVDSGNGAMGERARVWGAGGEHELGG